MTGNIPNLKQLIRETPSEEAQNDRRHVFSLSDLGVEDGHEAVDNFCLKLVAHENKIGNVVLIDPEAAEGEKVLFVPRGNNKEG